MATMHTAATASPVQSSLQAGVSPGSPPTPAVLSLFCQLSHGIPPPTVPATTIGPWPCPQPRALTATLWHPPSWRVTTCRHQRVPGAAAPGAMKAGGTCCISSWHITSRSTRFTLQALASMATSRVSSSSLCRGTGQHLDHVVIMAVVATRLTTLAARRTGLCRGHFNHVPLVGAETWN